MCEPTKWTFCVRYARRKIVILLGPLKKPCRYASTYEKCIWYGADLVRRADVNGIRDLSN